MNGTVLLAVNLTGVALDEAARLVAYYQGVVVGAYRWPLIVAVAALVGVQVLFAYRYRLARVFASSKDNNRCRSPDEYRLVFERVILWVLVTVTMILGGLLFLKFDVGVV